MNKQQFAFYQSAMQLKQTTGKLYFWTFTFAKVHNAWEYSHIWFNFLKDWQHLGSPMLMGLRVVQMHDTHGFHYHCLFNEWIDARQAWRVCRKHGIGHIDVMAIRNSVKQSFETAIHYVSRYLTSDSEKFPIKGLRRWGTIYGSPCTRMRDCQALYPAADAVSYGSKLWGRGSFGRDVIGAVVASPHCQSGDWKTLLCLFDYKQHARKDSFNWRERKMELALAHRPWRDWITRECTIYKPVFMPSLISSTESLYWSSQKIEQNKSCYVATSVIEYFVNPDTGMVETYEK